MYKYFNAFLLSIAVFNAYANEEHLSFKKGLDEHKEIIESSLAFYQAPAIYTKGAIGNNLFLLENDDLRLAGRELVVYLEDQHEFYYELSFEEWLLASEELLVLDDWLGQYSAWGNLVIKINICNKILYRTLDYLENQREILDEKRLSQLVRLQEKLRSHLPSRFAMYEIALRHYGKLNKGETQPFAFSPELGNESSFLESQVSSYFEDKKDLEESFDSFYKNESGKVINSYADIYDLPMTWHTASFSRYHSYAWNIYLYSKILQNVMPETLDWQSLDPDLVNSILEKELASNKGFWMPKSFQRYIKKPREGFIDRIKKRYFLDRVRSDFELGQKRRSMSVANVKFFEVFSPHAMP